MNTEKFTYEIEGSKRTISRTQFPVLPAYAITGYAAQGGTFDKAIVDLRVPEGKGRGFDNGADLYVLLSRVKNLKGLLILRPFQSTVLQNRPKHAVFKEIKRLMALEELSNNTNVTPLNTNECDFTEDTENPELDGIFSFELNNTYECDPDPLTSEDPQQNNDSFDYDEWRPPIPTLAQNDYDENTNSDYDEDYQLQTHGLLVLYSLFVCPFIHISRLSYVVYIQLLYKRMCVPYKGPPIPTLPQHDYDENTNSDLDKD